MCLPMIGAMADQTAVEPQARPFSVRIMFPARQRFDAHAHGRKWRSNGPASGHMPADKPIAANLVQAGLRHRVDPALLASLVRAESGFRADAISPRGALGLSQIMPDTARELGIEDPERLRRDPALAIDAGARYLRVLHGQFGNNLPLVLAGYNAGPGAVKRHGGVPPYPETRAYVRRVLADYRHRRGWRAQWQGQAQGQAL